MWLISHPKLISMTNCYSEYTLILVSNLSVQWNFSILFFLLCFFLFGEYLNIFYDSFKYNPSSSTSMAICKLKYLILIFFSCSALDNHEYKHLFMLFFFSFPASGLSQIRSSLP